MGTCTRRAAPIHCNAAPDEDASSSDLSISALRAEILKRAESGAVQDMGKKEALARIGPHANTSPRDVVEHVVTSCRGGDIHQAFRFTCIPVAKRGTHKSSTDWSMRMRWEKCKLIGDAPSGAACDTAGFEAMMRERYTPLLQTEAFRLVGDGSAWQQKNGHEKMTAPKEYVVEIKTKQGEHYLLKITLVYDWLVYCHLVASVALLSASTAKHFPGAEDIDVDI